jgi:Uma2 family endonuclease
MAVATEVVPDLVMSLRVGPGALENYRRLRGDTLEGGPLIKCRPGRLTLVSPSKDHERVDRRLGLLVVAVCSILKIPCGMAGSTLYPVPGTDYGYMPDESFYLRARTALAEQAGEPGGPPPDLVIEVVNTHPADDALASCERLRIPEAWVHDVRRRELVIWQRVRGGAHAGTLARRSRSRALPFLTADEIRDQLLGAPGDEAAFDRAVRRWVRRVLVPRVRDQEA